MRHSFTPPLMLGAIVFSVALFLSGQTVSGTPESHRAAAKAAAGKDLGGIFQAACPAPVEGGVAAAGRGPAGRGPGGTPRPEPPREQWYAEPVKVFDNLYYVGTKIHGAWAVTTSEGIIVLDALFGYAAEPEITDGLKKVGLDPAKIKYVIVSHGHGDHSGGAKYLQDTYKAHLILSAEDWQLLERDPKTSPRRDMVATDGQKLTLGDTTVTLYLTPGHTAGTISTLIPVKEGGKTYTAAEWGGTVISPRTPIPMLEAYIKSAGRFSDLALGSGAEIILTNHTAFDGTLAKLDALHNRKPGEPNPYVVGKEAVRRYLTVAEECGKTNLLEAQAAAK